ncbi:MAG: AraC family transcriptional regulator, partial [Pseudomonadota bacterium]
ANYRHRLNRVIDYTLANLGDPITLDKMADIACFSKYHFARVFEHECKQSPLRYLWRMRIESAARKLVFEPNRAITEIAIEAGFSSNQTFSQLFRNRYGVSPRTFRKLGEQNRNEIRNVQQFQMPSLYNVVIEWRPALRLAYIRCIGHGGDGISQAYQRLIAWAWKHNIDPESLPLVGVCPDNPNFTAEQFNIYDFAIPVPAEITEDETVSIQTIPAGTYAVLRTETPYQQHLDIWEWVLHEWLLETGEKYIQNWSYEYFPVWPGRSYKDISPTELCLRLEDRIG